ncbi:MAG: RNA polymerase sigma factor [Limisphaerales bacterium]
MAATEHSDAELVSRTLGGDRDAFSRIVSRYQILICSLAYSRIGHLGQSEDVAQETFITAWKHLRLLREPDKLRAWLCGIVRNRIHKSLRREGHEPVHDAMPLEEAHDVPAREALPSEQAISREEEAILWRSLERIPEIYREPFILFYREHQSIEYVADALELSEDAVKQRLSRGRKLLQEEVQAFVENTLRRTAPGEAFSVAVLAAMPLTTGSAATAGMGAGAKGTAAAKSGFLAAWLAPLAPFIGIFAGITANWLIVRAAPTARERRGLKFAFIALWVFVLAWCVPGQFAVRTLGQHWEWSDRTFIAVMAGFWWFSTIITATWIMVMFRQILAIRQQSEEEVGIPQTAGTPLKLGTRIAVVTGLYLSCFLWLIFLAWQAHDQVWVGIITGTMVVLGVWHFFQFRGRTGTAAMRAGFGRLTLAWGVILVVLNLRLDVWLAARREASLAEIHRLLPPWLIPVLTLALLTWIGILLAITKPKRSASRHEGGENGRGNNVKGLLLLMLLAGCFPTFIYPTMGQSQTPLAEKPTQADAAIPDQFRPLYQDLDETLRQDRQTYPFKKGNARPLVAPNLLMASSMFGPAASDSQRWKDLLATLDAYKTMKMDAVFVQILAPDLTFGDPGPLIDFYQRLAREIHSRNMKLYVEHFVNVPFKPNIPSSPHAHKGPHALKDLQDDPQGRQDFLKIMEQEDALIYREIKPDYLTLINEPETAINRMLHLTFSADELADWVGEVTTHLKSTGASPNTLLGAGAVTWEPEEFVLKFAKQTNLDYVDIHMYSIGLKLQGKDQVAKLATLVRKIREARPNMRITIGETWLLKLGAGDMGPKVTTYQEIFQRNNFSFWSPLDEQFLALLMGIAQKENISVVAPFFSQYFFTYYAFGDAESGKLPPGVGSSLSVTWNKALESIHSHQLSSTGKALGAMLDEDGK